MRPRIRLEYGLIVSLCLLASSPSLAQNGDYPSGNGLPKENVEARIHRQRMRIEQGVAAGTLSQQTATNLKQELDDLQARVNTQRNNNGGMLKPEQLMQVENMLNQTNQQIKSNEGAGTSLAQPGNVLGPKWTPGPDGAQNPTSLLQQMKQQEKRALRQEKQANEQTLEQQQIQYEQQMTSALGQQRKNILKKQQQLKQIRQESGSN